MMQRKLVITALLAMTLSGCLSSNNPGESSSSVPSSSSIQSSSSSQPQSSESSISSSSSVAQTSAYCPQNEPCKILPLGDSITEGMIQVNGGYEFNGGYRVSLFEAAVNDGNNITFVGRQSNGPNTVAGETFPKNNEGYSGWTIQQIDGIVPSPAMDDEPHIILLHIGTNDMFQGSNGAIDRLEALVRDIVNNQPDSLLAVSNVIPFPQASAAVNSYNAEIPGLVEQIANELDANIIFVDQFEGFPTGELGDGVHPNEAGYDRMGLKWYSAIEEYLN